MRLARPAIRSVHCSKLFLYLTLPPSSRIVEIILLNMLLMQLSAAWSTIMCIYVKRTSVGRYDQSGGTLLLPLVTITFVIHRSRSIFPLGALSLLSETASEAFGCVPKYLWSLSTLCSQSHIMDQSGEVYSAIWIAIRVNSPASCVYLSGNDRTCYCQRSTAPLAAAWQPCPVSALLVIVANYSSSSPPLSLFFFFFEPPDGAPSFFWWTFSLVHASSLSHSKPARTGSSNSSSAWKMMYQHLQVKFYRIWLPHLLLELFMDRIQGILDCYPFQVPCSDFKPQWEVEVNLLDRWSRKEFLQCFLVF